MGATGGQGGGLCRAILEDRGRPFTVRALTRDPDSGRAKELAALGAEVVYADHDDEASLRKAFDSAHGAYVVTNFWEQRSPEEHEARPAQDIVDLIDEDLLRELNPRIQSFDAWLGERPRH